MRELYKGESLIEGQIRNVEYKEYNQGKTKLCKFNIVNTWKNKSGEEKKNLYPVTMFHDNMKQAEEDAVAIEDGTFVSAIVKIRGSEYNGKFYCQLNVAEIVVQEVHSKAKSKVDDSAHPEHDELGGDEDDLPF